MRKASIYLLAGVVFSLQASAAANTIPTFTRTFTAGGGQVVTLNTSEDVRNFVTSVSEIVAKYQFDGVDLDIETPSLLINCGKTSGPPS